MFNISFVSLKTKLDLARRFRKHCDGL